MLALLEVIDLKKLSLRCSIARLNATRAICVQNPPAGFSSYLHNLFCLLFATIGFTSWNKSRDIEHLSSPFRYTTLAGCNRVCVYGLIPRRGLMR